jgi:hypothetical protein
VAGALAPATGVFPAGGSFPSAGMPVPSAGMPISKTWIIGGTGGTNAINGKGGTGFIQKRGNHKDTVVNAAHYTIAPK